jgi:ElaB/YqjD/DUF883 family membrane-anchored ribosome-binding protein
MPNAPTAGEPNGRPLIATRRELARRQPWDAPWVPLTAVGEVDSSRSGDDDRGDHDDSHQDDDFDVRLRWPAEAVDQPKSAMRPLGRPRPEPEPVPAPVSAPVRQAPAVDLGVGPALPRIAAEVHAVHETVMELLAQLEVATSATKALRKVVSDRLTDVTESIERLPKHDDAGTERALRALVSGLDEVRGDIAGLAEISTIAEPPTDEPSATDEPSTTAILEELTAARDATTASFDAFSAELVQELAKVLARSRADTSVSLDRVRGELSGELAEMRNELTNLKRRIAVRARGPVDGAAPVDARLSDDDLQRIASAVAEKLTESFEVVGQDAQSAPLPAAAAVDPTLTRQQRRARSRNR